MNDIVTFYIRFSILDQELLFVFLLFLVLVGAKRSSKTPPIKSDWDEIRQDCSSSKYASIDGVGFLICGHTFKMAAMTSFHTEKCCHLASAHAASARRICSSVRQFLIYSTFVLVSCFYNNSRIYYTCTNYRISYKHFSKKI